jgi:hypothetical protein
MVSFSDEEDEAGKGLLLLRRKKGRYGNQRQPGGLSDWLAGLGWAGLGC